MHLAFLIIAHEEFDILRRLVSSLDDESHDIYIHIDKKAGPLPDIETKASRLFMLEKRMDVRWGHVSQIACEYLLWETAVQNGPYDSYVLLSGTHLPLKPLDQVKAFFCQHKGKNLLQDFNQASGYQKTLKMNRYNLFLRNAHYGPGPRKRFFQLLWGGCIRIQNALDIQNHRDETFFASQNWVALTQEAVDYMLSVKRDVLKKYRYTFCGDEWFVATELAHSPLSATIVSPSNYVYCEWGEANPRFFTLEEYDSLCRRDFIFARKFKSQ